VKIALLTPSRDGRAHLDHSEAVAATRIEALRQGRQLIRYTGKGSANLPRNRNLLAARALKDGADVIFWVDCDIAFEPKDFFRLVDAQADIIAALPQKRTHSWGEGGAIAGVGIAKTPDPVTGFHKAEMLPTAFMAIKRQVFERMNEAGAAMPFIAHEAPEDLWPFLRNWFFYELRPSDTHPGQLEDDAEDYYFCRKWREIGGECWAAPDVRLHHYEGLVRHSLCLADVLKGPDNGNQG
jgi:glycosyltransferase involved in cell wall biosynthesis